MDGGPFRAPQPTDRKGTSRQELTRRPSDDETPPHNEVKSYRRGRPMRRVIKTIIWIVAAVIVLGASSWFIWGKVQDTRTGIDTSKYQAVFFTNGQTFFGKLKPYNSKYMMLTDIFYLQPQDGTASSSQASPQTSTDKANFQLIKYGNEIYGPEDEMMISRDQMLFYENLQPSGKVATSIDQFNKNKSN
ncbi:MAG: hypothetical protein ABI397_00890 [Candidatus Saccharimonas sp.]